MNIHMISNVQGCELRSYVFTSKREAIDCIKGQQYIYYFSITGGIDAGFAGHEELLDAFQDAWKERGHIMTNAQAVAEVNAWRRPTPTPKNPHTKVGRAIKTLLKHKSEHVDVLLVDALGQIANEIGLDKFDTNLRRELIDAFNKHR